MIIDISQSQLFYGDPDERFAKEFNVDKGIWTELWKRHALMGYTQAEMIEYFHLLTGRKPSFDSIGRWILRTKIYSISSPILKKGAIHVNTEIFGEYEDFVIKEVTKHLKSGASKSSKIVL